MPSLLFVDDEPNVLSGLRRMLRSQRGEWDMAFCESGQAAMEWLSKHHADAIVAVGRQELREDGYQAGFEDGRAEGLAETEAIADATEALADVLKTCRTLVWNGPLGAFETEPFDTATMTLARHAAALTQEGSLISVAGGGDTVAALAQAQVMDDVTYVSTAGGAFLEWMEGKQLPGVAALAN